MIERQFVGNRPQDQFVGETMGVDLLPSNPILTIADSCQPASPEPTRRRLIYIGPEANAVSVMLNRCIAMLAPKAIMAITIAAFLVGSLTIGNLAASIRGAVRTAPATAWARWSIAAGTATLRLHRNKPFGVMRPEAKSSRSRSILSYGGDPCSA